MKPGRIGKEGLGPAATSLWLGLIFALALAVRLWGIGFGLPSYFHPDEPITMDRVERMVALGDPNPHYFNYPPLSFYLQAVVLHLNGAGPAPDEVGSQADPRSRAREYLAGRAAMATVGALTVLPVYFAAAELAGSLAGLGAAAMLALTFLHSQQSQYIKPDAPSAFFVALCLMFSTRFLRRGGRRWLLGAGAAAGLAAATKYNAGLCLLTPLAAVALGAATQGGRLEAATRAKQLAFCGIVAALVFVVAVPWVILDPAAVFEGIRREVVHYQGRQFSAEGDDNLGFYLGYLWWQGLTPGPCLLALAGMLVLAREAPARLASWLAFALPYLALLVAVRVRFARNLVPVLPSVAVLAGIGLARVLEWLRAMSGRAAAVGFALVAALVVVWPLGRILLYDYFLAQEQTYVRAARWMNERLPEGSTVCIEHFAPVEWAPSLHVVPIGALPARSAEWLETSCDYAAAVSFLYATVLADPARHADAALRYDDLFARWPLVAEFRYSDSRWVRQILGEQLEVYHPVVRLLRSPRLPDGTPASRGAP